jgi:site-specific DNA-methyltransferase (adenine-specific)
MSNKYKLIKGNSIEELKQFPDNHFDSIVTDPPYELGFMGKSWDSTKIAYNEELWSECFRVLKPGGHLIAFSGSRTYHRMAVAIENSEFEIRDQMLWLYGTGFPKNLNISKAIDGKLQEVQVYRDTNYDEIDKKRLGKLKPSTEEAKQWDGWGTALKPAHEPMVLARKPLSEKTVSENVLKWGVGGLNIDDCRVEYKDIKNDVTNPNNDLGRWPANLIHDGSEEVKKIFPNDNSRFFYCAKASKKDRNDGLDNFELKGKIYNGNNTQSTVDGFKKLSVEDKFTTKPSANNHPTVKPTNLMAYLCRLVTPPGGIILDPFNGSGSTGKAAIRENFNYVGIDLSQEYLDISKSRIDNELNKTSLK